MVVSHSRFCSPPKVTTWLRNLRNPVLKNPHSAKSNKQTLEQLTALSQSQHLQLPTRNLQYLVSLTILKSNNNYTSFADLRLPDPHFSLLQILASTHDLQCANRNEREGGWDLSWGKTLHFHLCQPHQLLKSQGLERVKVFDSDPAVLRALAGSNIKVTVNRSPPPPSLNLLLPTGSSETSSLTTPTPRSKLFASAMRFSLTPTTPPSSSSVGY
ncbi:hypothetical protein EV1_034062 [Malus domestica]